MFPLSPINLLFHLTVLLKTSTQMENLMTKILVLQILYGFFLSFSGLGWFQQVESLGINYGQIGNNLPPPEKVLQLLRSVKLTKARIYDTNPEILSAFANSSIEIIVTVENEMLPTLTDPNQAIQWVYTHIRPYFPATNITGIAVGNEVYTGGSTDLIGYLVRAMVNIRGALTQLGLDQFIQVSTPNSLAVLQDSYPPSAGCFRADLAGIMPELLQFLADTRSPFWINAYPYFAYKDQPENIPLEYALFDPNPGMVDPNTNLSYDNMMYAQVDAVIFALARMGFNGLKVQVSETGWPSMGDEDEAGANVENAAAYNRNLMRRQRENEGTPLRPEMGLEVYVFALFNEDMKPGPTSERNYGLFRPDGTMVYSVGLSALSTTSTSSATIPLTSESNKVERSGHSSLLCSMFVYLLAFQLLMRRQL